MPCIYPGSKECRAGLTPQKQACMLYFIFQSIDLYKVVIAQKTQKSQARQQPRATLKMFTSIDMSFLSERPSFSQL
jgi:hypothetical protein